MTVNIHYRVVEAVGVEVEAVDCFGIKVAYVVGVDETSRFGVVVSGLQVVQLHVFVEVVATVTEGVEDTCITCSKDYCAIAVSVVGVFGYFGSTVVYGNNVSEDVLAVSIQCIVVNKTGQTFTCTKVDPL